MSSIKLEKLKLARQKLIIFEKDIEAMMRLLSDCNCNSDKCGYCNSILPLGSVPKILDNSIKLMTRVLENAS